MAKMGKKAEEKVALPPKWWQRYLIHYRAKLRSNYSTPHTAIGLSKKVIKRAIKINKMTRRSFEKMLRVGRFEEDSDLLHFFTDYNAEEPAEESKSTIVEVLFDLRRWGNGVSTASGSVVFFDHYVGKLAGHAKLEGLIPHHCYVLTINGRPGRPGNSALPQEYGVERYQDFLEVLTDADGANRHIPFQIDLPKGKYELKFLVKVRIPAKLTGHSAGT